MPAKDTVHARLGEEWLSEALRLLDLARKGIADTDGACPSYTTFAKLLVDPGSMDGFGRKQAGETLVDIAALSRAIPVAMELQFSCALPRALLP